MKYAGRKIANSFYLPKHPFLRGIASLMDFTGALNRDAIEQILERSKADATQSDIDAIQSDADAIRSDWEAVGENLWRAINEYEKQVRESREARPEFPTRSAIPGGRPDFPAP